MEEKTFLAEIKNVSSVKTISNDKETKIMFVSNDSSILDLGKLPPNTMFLVTVKVVSNEEMTAAQRTKMKGDFAFEI